MTNWEILLKPLSMAIDTTIHKKKTHVLAITIAHFPTDWRATFQLVGKIGKESREWRNVLVYAHLLLIKHARISVTN